MPDTLIAPVTELTFWLETNLWFPFVEDENCNITGPGHQEPIAFVHAIRAYDEACGVEAGSHDTAEVSHRWVVADSDAESFTPCSPDTPGAFPVTTLWGVR